MQIFSKDFKYSLKILSMLKSRGEFVAVKKMNDSGVPRSYAVRILAEMIKHHVAESREGRKGGYYLVVSVERAVSLLFGVSAIERLREIGQGRYFAN